MNHSVTRRNLLRAAFLTPVTLGVAAPLFSGSEAEAAPMQPQQKPDVGTGPFTLGPLPYPYKALEPAIDAKTMEIHHDRHHATYVKNLNDIAGKNPDVAKKSPVELITNLNDVPEAVRTAVRNNAGGHVNHTMFWEIMKPKGGGEPTGAIADAIKGTFGSFAAFTTAFNEAGTKRFGSGWVWLVRTKDGKMEIISTPNQDNPMMDGHYPILGNDVWEHAYYLKYQNKRADYLKAWWNTLNWEAVNKRLAEAK
jgi:superoxide dismutase, Fe-Mn family